MYNEYKMDWGTKFLAVFFFFIGTPISMLFLYIAIVDYKNTEVLSTLFLLFIALSALKEVISRIYWATIKPPKIVVDTNAFYIYSGDDLIETSPLNSQFYYRIYNKYKKGRQYCLVIDKEMDVRKEWNLSYLGKKQFMEIVSLTNAQQIR